jgi:hypothetical protein
VRVLSCDPSTIALVAMVSVSPPHVCAKKLAFGVSHGSDLQDLR